MIVNKPNQVEKVDLMQLPLGSAFNCNNTEYMRIALIKTAVLEDGQVLQNVVGVHLESGMFLQTNLDEDSAQYRLVTPVDAEVTVN